MQLTNDNSEKKIWHYLNYKTKKNTNNDEIIFNHTMRQLCLYLDRLEAHQEIYDKPVTNTKIPRILKLLSRFKEIAFLRHVSSNFPKLPSCESSFLAYIRSLQLYSRMSYRLFSSLGRVG